MLTRKGKPLLGAKKRAKHHCRDCDGSSSGTLTLRSVDGQQTNVTCAKLLGSSGHGGTINGSPA